MISRLLNQLNSATIVDMANVTMNITGMHCGACATGIQMVTEQMDGVSTSKVDYDSGVGEFEYDEATTNPEAIISEIEKLEYKAEVAS